jgi:hypothetical protein
MSFLDRNGTPWGTIFFAQPGTIKVGINMEFVDFSRHDVQHVLEDYASKNDLYTNGTINVVIRGTGHTALRTDEYKMGALKKAFPFMYLESKPDAAFPQWAGIMQAPALSYKDTALVPRRSDTIEFDPDQHGGAYGDPHTPIPITSMTIPAIDGRLYYD